MFAGIDTHKDTLAVAVINTAGRVVTNRSIRTTTTATNGHSACSPGTV